MSNMIKLAIEIVVVVIVFFLGLRMSVQDATDGPINLLDLHPVVTATVDIEEETLADTEQTRQAVTLTNYYPSDSSGSGRTTGSGLSVNNFGTNHLGWYTYDGLVVIATATEECLASNDSGCRPYKTVPDGYHLFKYWDYVTIEVDGVYHQAVVLDSCGACFWPESKQRIDIFVREDSRFGRITDAFVIYKEDHK